MLFRSSRTWIILCIATLAVVGCQSGKNSSTGNRSPEGKTVIYDPKAMSRIGPDAVKSIYNLKDYYVNVLVVEVPNSFGGDFSLSQVLPLSEREKSHLKIVKNADPRTTLSPELAATFKHELLLSEHSFGSILTMSWNKSPANTFNVELNGKRSPVVSETNALKSLSKNLTAGGDGTNAWITLPPSEASITAKRLKSIIDATRRLDVRERTLIFILPTGRPSENSESVQSTPIMISNSSDLSESGEISDILPTLREAFHSDAFAGTAKSNAAAPKGKSLFLNFADLDDHNRVGVAYFLGGRTAILYRAFLADQFRKTGVNVELYSKNIYDRNGKGFLTHRDYYRMPQEQAFTKDQFKATGIELIEFMMSIGKIGATIGETAFLQGLELNVPMVAVAELGFDSKETPGHAIVLCKNLPYEKPQDLIGKKFGSRRSAGGDELFLREFFSSIGLDPSKDVQIAGNTPDDILKIKLRNGELDGMYAHLMSIPGMPPHCRVIRKLDWVNPEMSSALLVFPKDWLAKHRDDVKAVLRVITEQIHQEHALTKADRRSKKWQNKKGLEIEMNTEDMQLPQVRELPTVRVEMLTAMKKLLQKHNVFKGSFDVASAVDNSLLEEIGAEKKQHPSESVQK